MRVAFVGKGGSGKSSIAGTVARLLARSGEPVLALDVDTLPGLSLSIGLGRVPDAGLPADLAERREKVGWVLREPVSAEELVERHALPGPDGIRFLQLGKLPGNVRPGSSVAFRHVLDEFRKPGWSMVGELAAVLVPDDLALRDADASGAVPFDAAPSAPAVLALSGVARALVQNP